MNLVSTLQIHAGGPGSGCNPAVGRCGRPAGKGVSNDEDSKSIQDALGKSLSPRLISVNRDYHPLAIKGAAEKLAEAGLDTRLLENRQVPKISFGRLIQEQPGVDGQYDRSDGHIVVLNPSDTDALIHELGHHLENAWLYHEDIPGEIRFKGGPAIDEDKVKKFRAAEWDEFSDARNDAARKAGDKQGWTGGDDRYAFIRDKLNTISVNAARPYSLSNLREWFATSFEDYMSGYYGRARLKRVAPKTYDYIDSFIHGKLFKNASN